jgi:hypothetical protein
VRLRGGTHVPASVIHQLPVPVDAPPAVVKSIAALARTLAEGPRAGASARLQAQIAQLYGLAHDEFAHVLSTFPLIADAERAAALEAGEL